jgi:hypothetical protein
MPKRLSSLNADHALLHSNHSFELLVASWFMEAGWHVFWPLLDAAHAIDLVVLDGPKSYRVQVKTVESQDMNQLVKNCWKKRHVDYVIYFARCSNWGYVCPAFATNQKRLDDASHRQFTWDCKSFVSAFQACDPVGDGSAIRSTLQIHPGRTTIPK